MTPHAPSDKTKLVILWLICLSEFIIALDFAIMNVMLPSLRETLGFSQSELQWVVSAYAVAFGGFLLLGGRAADLFGRRRVLLLGLCGFTAASTFAALGTEPWQLIGGRGAQGLSAALITPAAFSLLTTLFSSEKERQTAMGAWGAVLGAGFVSGVVAGGAITEYLGWSWVFWLNVPIGVVLIASIAVVVPRIEAERAERRLDVAGAVLVTMSVVVLVFGLTKAGLDGWSSTGALAAIAGGLALGVLFLVVEARTAAPLIPLKELRSRTMIVMNLSNALLAGGFFGLLFMLTLFLQGAMQFTPLQTGMTFAAAGAAGMAAGITSSLFARRFGIKRALVVGATVQAAATALLLLLPQDSTQVFVAVTMVVVNFSGVVALVMININAMANVEERDQGFVGGLLVTCEQIGGAIGLAVIAAIANGHANAPLSTANAGLDGYRWGIALAAGITLAGGLVVLVGMRESRAADSPSSDAGDGLELAPSLPAPVLDGSAA
jgi:EmrB/QacA subfamily drug resistance transporter